MQRRPSPRPPPRGARRGSASRKSGCCPRALKRETVARGSLCARYRGGDAIARWARVRHALALRPSASSAPCGERSPTRVPPSPVGRARASPSRTRSAPPPRSRLRVDPISHLGVAVKHAAGCTWGARAGGLSRPRQRPPAIISAPLSGLDLPCCLRVLPRGRRVWSRPPEHVGASALTAFAPASAQRPHAQAPTGAPQAVAGERCRGRGKLVRLAWRAERRMLHGALTEGTRHRRDKGTFGGTPARAIEPYTVLHREGVSGGSHRCASVSNESEAR